MIEYVIIMLNDYKKNSSIEDVLIIGGIQNQYYRQLNDCLCSIRRGYSTILPKLITNALVCLSRKLNTTTFV